jgi:hypothetical protein
VEQELAWALAARIVDDLRLRIGGCDLNGGDSSGQEAEVG